MPLGRGLYLTKVVSFTLGKSKVTRALLTIGQQALSAEALRAFLFELHKLNQKFTPALNRGEAN